LSAGENLRLNDKLDYTSDSQDGPLITGDGMDAGVTSGEPAYIIFYGEGCYNSKRPARRTVSLYEKYRGRVQFVIIGLDHRASAAQQELQNIIAVTFRMWSCSTPRARRLTTSLARWSDCGTSG
jgi:hypothetical protein